MSNTIRLIALGIVKSLYKLHCTGVKNHTPVLGLHDEPKPDNGQSRKGKNKFQ